MKVVNLGLARACYESINLISNMMLALLVLLLNKQNLCTNPPLPNRKLTKIMAKRVTLQWGYHRSCPPASPRPSAATGSWSKYSNLAVYFRTTQVLTEVNLAHCNKYLSMSSVKKGKIPVKGHSLILSIDSTSSHKQNKGSKSGWRLNKPCPLSANLPVRPIYINLKHYCKNYGIKGYKLCKHFYSLGQGDILKIGNKRVRVFSLNPTISVGGHPTN